MDATSEWNRRFREKGHLWGDEPSPTAIELLKLVKDGKILETGCGYGRDYRFFLENGFDAVGIDSSAEAIKLAKENLPEGSFIVADATEMPFNASSFDVVFSHLFIHLLYKDEDRQKFISECKRVLKPGGLMISSFFSTDDATFGEGDEIAKNTFHVKRKARTGRFFEEAEVREDFKHFKIIELKKLKEVHVHGSPHTHIYWFLIAKLA